MRVAARWVCLMAVLLAQQNVARAFSMGAPDSICDNLLPGHGASSQTSPSPFNIILAPIEDPSGRRLVNVTITGQEGLNFAGFVIQARPENGISALGSFEVQPDSGKTYTCGSGLKNTVTHTNKTPKKKIELVWEAPSDYNGNVIFNATAVVDYATFWTGILSSPLVVRRTGNGPSIETSSRKPASKIPIKPSSSTVKTPPRPQSENQVANPVYEGCNSLKGCFGFPSNCVGSKSCRSLVTYTVKGEIYEFELFGDGRVWSAAAFSNDRIMAADSVMECTYENDQVKVFSSWNEDPGKANHRYEPSGLTLLDSSYKDGQLYCKFSRPKVTMVEGVQFDLERQYHLFIASGNDFKGNRLGYHGNERDLTAEKISLSDYQSAAGASKILVYLHGSFMVAAWIGSASIGILLARYFKKTWVGSQLCGKDQWFAWHRIFMLFTWCLTMAGFVIIFIELQGWSSVDNPHAILGCITTGLAFIQPFMAALRPAPSSPKRPLFNWCHWLVGNLAHIFAIVTIFFSVLLSRVKLPEWMNWILVGYVAFHVFMHLIFSIMGCASDKKSSNRTSAFPMRDMSHHRNPHHPHYEKNQDASYSSLRKFLFAIYFIGVVCLSVALIILIVFEPIDETFRDLKKTLNI